MAAGLSTAAKSSLSGASALHFSGEDVLVHAELPGSLIAEYCKPTALQGNPIVFGWLGEPTGVRIGWPGTASSPFTSEL